MTARKGLLCAVATSVLGIFAASFAVAGTNAGASEYSLTSDPMLPPDTDTHGLLQTEMTDRGYGGSTMDQYGLKLTGYAEVGWTFNFNRPPAGFNGIYQIFDDKSDDPTLNQISISLQREALVSPDRFDTGFNVQLVYGSDVKYTQSNGTNFYGNGVANKQVPQPGNDRLLVIIPGQQYPENQLAVMQAYMSFNLPYANGILLTAGKFFTPWGMESIDPTKNLLYTHSYMFSGGQPYTLTGLMADYKLDDTWRLKGGLVVGWDQSLKDNNDFPSFFGQVGYKASDDLDLALSVMTGPEKPDNRSDYRWLVDFTANYRLGADWMLGFEGQFGYDEDTTTTLLEDHSREFLFSDGAWWGGAAYSSYKLDNEGMFILNVRGEYWNDNGGMRQLITEVYAGTMGLSIRPFVNDRIGKHLVIRPELRYEWALDHVYDDDDRNQQVSASIDAVFDF